MHDEVASLTEVTREFFDACVVARDRAILQAVDEASRFGMGVLVDDGRAIAFGHPSVPHREIYFKPISLEDANIAGWLDR